VLDDFKRDFLNATDKRAALDRFWGKFDANGWSFWFMQYQNLPSEGKILWKTVNSANFFLQKLDHFRKYTFGVYGVYGVEENYVCRGIFMWRGLDTPQEVKDHDNYEFMDMKNLDPVKDRELIESYWLKMKEGEEVDGRKVAETQSFK